MASETTYTHARSNLASLCDHVSESREVIIIRRRNAEDVALIAAGELSSLMETVHLLRSPRNAQRLLAAIQRAHTRAEPSSSLDGLRRETELEPE